MGNNLTNPCLKTQLKGSFGDNSSIKLGELKVVVSIPANSRIVLNFSKDEGYDCSIRTITSGIKFSESVEGELTDTFNFSNSSYYFKDVYIDNSNNVTTKAVLFVSNKYLLITQITLNSLSFKNGARLYTETYKGESSDWLDFKRLCSTINNDGLIGTVMDCTGMYNITNIKIQDQNDVDISVYNVFTKITNLDINNKVFGNIASIGKLTSLTNFAYGQSNCSGTIESFVLAQRKNGRNSASITGNSTNNSGVTFNGNTDNAKGTLVWTPNNKDSKNTDITMNGITITIDSEGKVVN